VTFSELHVYGEFLHYGKDNHQSLKRLGLRQSVGRTGICYDNSMAESFFGALKHAYRDIARYIEFRCNSRRRHSGLAA
jgi:transposase InsO family protein